MANTNLITLGVMVTHQVHMVGVMMTSHTQSSLVKNDSR